MSDNTDTIGALKYATRLTEIVNKCYLAVTEEP